MTYLSAARKAKEAAAKARSANMHYSETEDEYLAQAVALLSEAVEELARTLHRESD